MIASSVILTYRFRVKDKHQRELCRQARAVNFVWNFCNETQIAALRWRKRWPNTYDLQKLTAGSSRELRLNGHTIQKVCETFTRSRDARRTPKLRWRGKKSLGWVPFNTGSVKFDGEAFVFRGLRYFAWVSRVLEPGRTFGAGSFSQDALGRWYINLSVKVEVEPSHVGPEVGIDLGLKDIATLSTGRKIEHPRWHRAMERRIATAQRARKKKAVKRLHAKAAAQRRDFLHKESLRIVQEHGAIFVGNVKPSAIAKTSMSKSSLDAGWSMFKQQLEYKAIARGVLFAEVNEAWATQICSRCGSVEGPKGVAGLGMRRWTCSCGAEHDRDVNAARVIAARGLASLAEGALT